MHYLFVDRQRPRLQRILNYGSMTTLLIQPSFMKYASKKDVSRLNQVSAAISAKGWDLGATKAIVMKNKNGPNGERYVRVQFRDNKGEYVGSMYI